MNPQVTGSHLIVDPVGGLEEYRSPERDSEHPSPQYVPLLTPSPVNNRSHSYRVARPSA
jgi:hypothetical protein